MPATVVHCPAESCGHKQTVPTSTNPRVWFSCDECKRLLVWFPRERVCKLAREHAEQERKV